MIDFHNDDGTLPLESNFTRKTLSATLFSRNGPRLLDKWADKIAKDALKTYGPDTIDLAATKLKPKDRDKLIARLRDIHGCDNAGLVYFINNYYTNEISLAMHTSATSTPEYAIVSYKNPGTIAHEYLHLFGAIDLYISPFDRGKASRKRKQVAMERFPNEIMAFAHRSIDSLDVSTLN